MKRRRRPIRPAPYRRYEAATIMPARARRGSVVRRRETPQAEARELDRPRLVSGSIVLTAVLVGLWISVSDSFYVGTPNVTGQARVPVDEIVTGSGLAGLHVLWVNASAVEAALLRTTPSLRAARVMCALPANCAIRVAEREPVFAWHWGQATVWIDQDGAVFPARSDPATLPSGAGQAAPALPLVESTDAHPPQPGQRIEPKLMTAITAAMQALPDVRAFRYSAARGLEFGDAGGYPVYLGTGSNMADRALVWRALRDDLAARGIKPAFIDVRFPLAPYYGK